VEITGPHTANSNASGYDAAAGRFGPPTPLSDVVKVKMVRQNER
jgi:hypothetical protein